MDFTMTGPEKEQAELLRDNLMEAHRTWLTKIMMYIYEHFFHDPSQDVYSYKDDTTLLKTVTWMTLIIFILFWIKLRAYFKYRHLIQVQIEVVNAKWQSMMVSINILQKIMQLHEAIVSNQRRIEQMRPKMSVSDTEQVGECSERKPLSLEQSQVGKFLNKGNEKELVTALNKTRKCSDNEMLEPVSRKGITRYTVLSATAKSRSQPDLTLLDSGVDKLEMKSSPSDTTLGDLPSNGKGIYSSIKDIFYPKNCDFVDCDGEEPDNEMSRMNDNHFNDYIAFRDDGDACRTQIMEFINELEIVQASKLNLSLDKHEQITNVLKALLSRTFDELRIIKEDLTKF